MKVLFIGNSYTYVNDLPLMVKELGGNLGIEIECVSNVKGGGYLSERLDDNNEMFHKLREQIVKGDIDKVVIQEQSFFPALDKAAFLRSAIGIASLFSPEVELFFYQTWPYKDKSEKLRSVGAEYYEMHAALKEAYNEAAMMTGGVVCPVGDAFVRMKDSGVELYDPDGSHLARIGTYLAACVICSKLTNVAPSTFRSLSGLDENEAQLVRDASSYVTSDIG